MRTTSLEAYKSIDLPKQERNVLGALITLDSKASNRKIAQYLGMDCSTVSGRMNGLYHKGYVFEGDKEKCPVTKKNVIQWVLNTDMDLKIDKKEFDGYINNSRLHYKKVSNLGSTLIDANSPSDFFPHLVEAVKWYQSTKK